MKMVIGGAYQGKLQWAREHFKDLSIDTWIDGETCEMEDIFCCGGIYHFHQYIERLMESSCETRLQFVQLLIEKNPQIIIITDEIGYGIVPLDKKEREYREFVGRVCTALAKESDEVYRVICGIGSRLK